MCVCACLCLSQMKVRGERDRITGRGEGGERRLPLLITDARRCMHIHTGTRVRGAHIAGERHSGMRCLLPLPYPIVAALVTGDSAASAMPSANARLSHYIAAL